MTGFLPTSGPHALEGATHTLYRVVPTGAATDTAEHLYRQHALLVTHFGSLPDAIRAIACLLDCAHVIGHKPAPPGVIVNLLVAARALEER